MVPEEQQNSTFSKIFPKRKTDIPKELIPYIPRVLEIPLESGGFAAITFQMGGLKYVEGMYHANALNSIQID